jgi:hypothetical protein
MNKLVLINYLTLITASLLLVASLSEKKIFGIIVGAVLIIYSIFRIKVLKNKY